MKHLIALVCLLGFGLFSVTAKAEFKVGLVDIQRILLTTTDGQDVMAKLEKKFNARKADLKKEEDKIKKASEDYKKQSLVLSDKAKMAKEREIQSMIVQLQNQTMEAQKTINQLEQELKKPLIDKIQLVVMEVSKKAGVALTFEVSTSPLVYAEKRVDLTEEVVTAYNAKHGSKK